MDTQAIVDKMCSEIETFLKLLSALGALDSFSFTYKVSERGLKEGRLLQHAWETVTIKLTDVIQELAGKKFDCSASEVQACYFCKTCRKQFATSKLLNSHIDSIHSSKPFNLNLVKELDGEDEVQEYNAANNIFVSCRHCHFTYRDGEEFHHQCADKHACSLPIFINDPKLLKDLKRFVCGYCQEEFRQLHRMRYHLNKCQGPPFPCDICGEEFTTRRSLNDHKAERHSSDMPFRCDECPKRFKLNTSLQKHLSSRHEKQSGSSFGCGKCGKRFQKRLYLTNHQTRFHNLFKPFLCQICGDRFISSSSLDSHAKIHEGIKQFKCSVCEKAFRRKDKLTLHEATHTGLRPFLCNRCPKAFICKPKLRDHLMRHDGIKRFLCLVCNKMYSSSCDIRRHYNKNHQQRNVNNNAQRIMSPSDLVKYQKARNYLGHSTLNTPLEVDINKLKTANVGYIDIRELGL